MNEDVQNGMTFGDRVEARVVRGEQSWTFFYIVLGFSDPEQRIAPNR